MIDLGWWSLMQGCENVTIAGKPAE